MCLICFFFFKQKTAYEMRISDWSSDVCSSDLPGAYKLGTYTTYNGSVNWDVTEDFKLSFLVNNLFNKMPTMDRMNYPGSSGAPYNTGNFNPYGRAYHLEARWNFGKAE